MRVLVIDTALGACTTAVYEADRCLAVRSDPMAKGHQERLGGLVRDVVAEAGGFDRIDRIGVTVGPGSFTGLRVGLAFAQGLGAALGRPVVGISTLAALAWSPEGAGATAAVIDARRGQVYIQTFLNGVATREPQALSIDDAVALLAEAGATWRFAGSGAALVQPDGTSNAALPAADNPTAAGLAALTLAADPETALPSPLYLRAPDATPPTRLPGQARAKPLAAADSART